MRKICVAYGTNPPDPAEAKFNKLVAEDVAHTLASLGWAPGLTGLRGDSTEPMEEMDVFNLCDGDDKDRFGLVSFAEELESMGCRFTGSSAKILALGKEKTLSWLDPELTPRWWELPPENQQYIAKPRSAHGSLLISPANINGSALSFSPIEYFFQELLEGCELTACFLGREFLGLTVVRATGIISRDDKWDENVLKARKPRVWDRSGETFPQVKAAACRAWEQLLAQDPSAGCSYGRVDVRLDTHGRAYVLDLNPNAYLGRNGNFYSCWISRGGTFGGLIAILVGDMRQKNN